MKLIFLGTSAGTEPFKDSCHQSFALQSGESLYFFDAGENCSRTAYLNGLDLLSTKAVFITHTHMDHVGGLGNLLWNIRKLHSNTNYQSTVCDKTVFIPNQSTFNAFLQILRNSENGFNIQFGLDCKEYMAGKIYEDDAIKVTAYPTTHLGTNPVLSYCFLIECEGKKILYSGDLGALADLDTPLCGGVDALICETGHFKVSDVCEYARKKEITKLLFSHNGREILNYRTQCECAIKNIFGKAADLCYDGMQINL